MQLSDGRWMSRAPIPTPRHDMRCFSVDGSVLLVSGADQQTYATTPTYDPDADVWTHDRSPIPTARGWYGAARRDGIYVVGGKRVRKAYREDGTPPQYDVYARLEHYDPGTDSWQRLAPLPGPRAGLSAAFRAGKLYAVGGIVPPTEEAFADLHDDPTVTGYYPPRQTWTETDRIDVYDPSSDAWEPGPSLPEPRMAPAVECVDGDLYVFGGYCDGTFVDDVYRLDAGSGEWEELTLMGTRRRDFPTIVADRTVYAFGGVRDGTRTREDGEEIERYTAACEAYDVDADEWTPLPDLPQEKAWAGAALVDGRLFVLGGAYRSAHEFVFTDEVHELVRST